MSEVTQRDDAVAEQSPIKQVQRYAKALFLTGSLALGVSMAKEELSYDIASAEPVTTGFLSTPTDQLGIPGIISGAEITPEGDIYTGWAEYELHYGNQLKSWNQPTRTLPDPKTPLLTSALSDGPVKYQLTDFAIPVDGIPVAYETVTVTNDSKSAQIAKLAMGAAYTRGRTTKGVHDLPTADYRYERPASSLLDGYYDQPGESYSPDFKYGTSGRDIVRSGLLLARGPDQQGLPLAVVSKGNTPTRPYLARYYQDKLSPHEQVSFTWQMPLEEEPAGSNIDKTLDSVNLTSAKMELEQEWSEQEQGMMQISLPEQKVTDTYYAALVEMLQSRYLSDKGWVEGSNKLQYQAFWIRDAALESQALDLAGLHDQAEQNLNFMDTFQQPDGLFISRNEQYDGWGQALWAFNQHAQLTDDAEYAASQLNQVRDAVNWLEETISSDPLGLLTPGNPNDDELAYGHITGDNIWAAVGLRSAIALAKLAGRNDLAVAWQKLDDQFETSLDNAIKAAVISVGHIPPVLDGAGGQDWGNYYAAYPMQILDPNSSEVKSTVAWAQAHMVNGLPTYNNGKSLHDYLGFSIFQTELLEGDVSKAIDGLYAELTHTTSTDNGWEWDIQPYGPRSTAIDMSPHGTFAADYVALLRNMLVSEQPNNAIKLLSGASPAWLKPGEQISVINAPTDYGTITFTEKSSVKGETINWHGNLMPGVELIWSLPSWAKDITVSGHQTADRNVELNGSEGSLTVNFEGRGPQQSYKLAAAALNKAYEMRGLSPPLVPAKQ